MHEWQVPGEHDGLNCTKNKCQSNYKYVGSSLKKPTLDRG